MSERKITYRHLTISEEDSLRVAHLLGYEEEGRRWYVYRVPRLSVKSAAKFEEYGMFPYLPTFKVEVTRAGKKLIEERPKIQNYLFVLAEFQQMEALSKAENVAPIRKRYTGGEPLKYDEQWQTIPNYEMNQLMLVVQGYEYEVEFCTPPEHELDKGDYVRVVSGEHRGIEGVMACHQRSGSSRVYVSVMGKLKMKSVPISDDCIKVIRVSRQTNRFHRRIEAFEHLADECLERRAAGKTITSEQRAALKFFVFRYDELTELTHVNEAKLVTCLYMAHTLLGCPREAEECMAAYQDKLNSTKSNRRSARRSPSAQLYIDYWLGKLQSPA